MSATGQGGSVPGGQSNKIGKPLSQSHAGIIGSYSLPGPAPDRGEPPHHPAGNGQCPGCQSWQGQLLPQGPVGEDRKSTRLNSSHVKISYAVFCLKKKKQNPYLS